MSSSQVKDSFCTMLNYKDILKIKHERFGYKFPKLEEVMNYLRVDKGEVKNVLSIITGDKNIGYHDARYDIACTYIAFKCFESINSKDEFDNFLEKSNNKPVSLEENTTNKKKSLSEIIKKCFSFLTKKK